MTMFPLLFVAVLSAPAVVEPVGAQTDTLIPPSAYAARRAKLASVAGPGAIIVNGRNLVGQHELPRQDANFWYLTGVESPYAILVMARDTRPGAVSGATRTALFLPDTFEFAGAQMPMVDSGFRRAAWNQPRHRLAAGPGAARLTGIPETFPLREFATRVREIVGNSPVVFLPRATDSLFAPPGVAKPITAEEQTWRAEGALFPGRRIEDVTPLVKKLRLVKDRYEIAALREAASISAQSMVTLMRRVKPGMNDLEAAGILEAEWKRFGAQRAAFSPIISSGPNAMTFFSLVGERYDAVGRVMKAGDLLFNDYGAAEVRRYASDVCRTFPVSGVFTPDQRKYYDIVLEAQDAAIAAIRPGVMMVDATDSRDWTGPLAAGMIVTVEPKIYIPEKNIAIMIEDMILVTPGGRENLSILAPKKAADIERTMRQP